MTLVSSVWREVTQKLGLLKALIGFCTIAGEESKRKAEPRTRSASRLSLAEMKRFELLRRGTPDLPHFECGPFSHLGTSPKVSDYYIKSFAIYQGRMVENNSIG